MTPTDHPDSGPERKVNLIAKVFFRGLGILIPIGLTLYAVYWLILAAERWLGSGLQAILSMTPIPYLPGMGVVAMLLLVFLVGLGTFSRTFRRLVDYLGDLLGRIPLVKTLYGGLTDLMDFVRQGRDRQQGLSHVVSVEIRQGWSLVGFVTRETFEQLPEQLSPDGTDKVAVYLPMSYQIGGFTVYLPRRQVTRLDMSVEDAMRLSLTAGMSIGSRDGKASRGRLTEHLGGPQNPAPKRSETPASRDTPAGRGTKR
jgi:uncharacterized membrane protein